MKGYKKQTALTELGTAIGIGLMAGLAGTIAMTISQAIEMRITGRQSSDTPANAVREVLDVKPVTEGKTKEVSTKIHWVYGTTLGLVRGGLSLLGLKKLLATTIHFIIIWSTELIMLPSLRVAPPVTKQKPKAVLTDAFHHIVYALTAGYVFDAINKKKQFAGKRNKVPIINQLAS